MLPSSSGNKRNVISIRTAYTGFDSRSHDSSKSATVAGASTGAARNQNNDDDDVPKVATRFYKPHEWRKLLKAGLTDKVLELRRQKAEHDKGKKSKKVKTEHSS